jgi:hypothetical protein
MEVFMPTIDVPRNEWPGFLETFSRQHRAWLATVESPLAPAHEERPLAAVEPRRDGSRVSAIEISFTGEAGEESVCVADPTTVRVHRTDEGADRALDIVDRDGNRTRIGFRVTATPDMLDGLAPGEL